MEAKTIQPHIIEEDGTATQIDFLTKASSVKLSDGTSVEENLSGINSLLESIVGVP